MNDLNFIPQLTRLKIFFTLPYVFENIQRNLYIINEISDKNFNGTY